MQWVTKKLTETFRQGKGLHSMFALVREPVVDDPSSLQTRGVTVVKETFSKTCHGVTVCIFVISKD